MQLVCGCLNIRINIQENVKDCLPSLDGLSRKEKNHPFFSQGIYLVTLVSNGLEEQQKFLIKLYNVGLWKIYECLNCKKMTHAVHKQKQLFAISTSLIHNDALIKMMQSCENFSPVFHIILSGSADISVSASVVHGVDASEHYSYVENLVQNFIRKARLKVEENIQNYMEQQQSALASIEVQAVADKEKIFSILSSQFDEHLLHHSPSDLVQENISRSGTEKPGECLWEESCSEISNQIQGMEISSSNIKPEDDTTHDNLYPGEMFLMEGVSDLAQEMSDLDDTDEVANESGDDEGISIPKVTKARPIARSAPVNVPFHPLQHVYAELDKNQTEKSGTVAERIANTLNIARNLLPNEDLFEEYPFDEHF